MSPAWRRPWRTETFGDATVVFDADTKTVLRIAGDRPLVALIVEAVNAHEAAGGAFAIRGEDYIRSSVIYLESQAENARLRTALEEAEKWLLPDFFDSAGAQAAVLECSKQARAALKGEQP